MMKQNPIIYVLFGFILLACTDKQVLGPYTLGVIMTDNVNFLNKTAIIFYDQTGKQIQTVSVPYGGAYLSSAKASINANNTLYVPLQGSYLNRHDKILALELQTGAT